jgi:hypothetical protein
MMSLDEFVSFTNPADLPLSALGLEIVVYIGFVLTVRHMWGEYRRGDSYPLFLWIALFIYGLIMELVSFNFFDNYAHATFSVQFYYGQLPLYVTCIYMFFHYTGIQLVSRLKLPRLQEGLLAGMAIMAIDIPFDILGVDAGWWIWKDNSHIAIHERFVEAVATRFYNVPVSSYLWYLMYGAIIAILSRTVYRWVERRPLALRICVAPLVSVAVFVLGALAFEVVFWTPARFGVDHKTIVLVYLIVAWTYALSIRAPHAESAPRWVYFNLCLFYGFHGALLLSLWMNGSANHPGIKALLFILGATGLVLIAIIFPLRRSIATHVDTPE